MQLCISFMISRLRHQLQITGSHNMLVRPDLWQEGKGSSCAQLQQAGRGTRCSSADGGNYVTPEVVRCQRVRLHHPIWVRVWHLLLPAPICQPAVQAVQLAPSTCYLARVHRLRTEQSLATHANWKWQCGGHLHWIAQTQRVATEQPRAWKKFQ